MNMLARYGYTGPVNMLGQASFGPTGWDRDSVLPFARRVEDGSVVRGGGVLGSDWHFAAPQFVADAWNTVNMLARSPVVEPMRRDEETRQHMIDAAGAVVGPMAGVGMARNVLAPTSGAELGIFGGRMAKTANYEKLVQAEKMAAEGVPREQIWNDTGWFRGVDGKWRFEIDDSSSTIRSADANFGALQDVVSHGGFFSAYPGAGKTPTDIGQKYGRGGAYYDAPIEQIVVGTKDQRPVLLHEMQHLVQNREGFSRGASPESPDVIKYVDEANARGRQAFKDAEMSAEKLIRASMAETGMAYAEAKRKFMSDNPGVAEYMKRMEADYRMSSMQAYKAAAGEVESRTVEKRADLTPEQRAARPPWLDYDVPEAQQIVRFK